MYDIVAALKVYSMVFVVKCLNEDTLPHVVRCIKSTFVSLTRFQIFVFWGNSIVWHACVYLSCIFPWTHSWITNKLLTSTLLWLHFHIRFCEWITAQQLFHIILHILLQWNCKCLSEAFVDALFSCSMCCVQLCYYFLLI